jgi:hypothetical protein
MNYILSYNHCNLDKVEYSVTDITSISDDVQVSQIYLLHFCIIPASLRTPSLIEVISVPLYSTLFKLQQLYDNM